ncbi:peptidase C14 [Trametes coccinea BRFM310]|uniref:Peptidase C14 n=1 Tax=Trametes coccinea (strain BRFM310) TaxID=1353009 RepID=A0A1Y2IMK0_TRAC3|nr:peptidase C14 [Trametes coccinea BRFM310]
MPAILSRVHSSEAVKKALLIGIQYSSTLARDYPQLELIGAHKDPHALRKVLIDLFGYKDENIKILIDDESGQYDMPTRENILAAMRDLVKDAQPGDRFVFSFSGHGSQVVNEDGTEEDGYDETLIPLDATWNADTNEFENYIKDDDIRGILVNDLPSGSHLTMVFDCCHSGTASDLPSVFSDSLASPASPLTTFSAKLPWKSHVPSIDADEIGFARMAMDDSVQLATGWMRGTHKRNRSNTMPPQSPGPAVTSWSACMDSQNTFGGRSGGFFIKAFTEALRKNPHRSHTELLHSIRGELAKRVAAHNMMLRKKGMVLGPDNEATSPRAQLCSLRPTFSWSSQIVI